MDKLERPKYGEFLGRLRYEPEATGAYCDKLDEYCDQLETERDQLEKENKKLEDGIDKILIEVRRIR